MPKVFALYYDRFNDATTSEALFEAGIEHNILCHNNKNKFKNIYGIINESNKPKGIQNNFNFGLDLLFDNEWGIFISDDYKKSYKIDRQKNKFVECELKYVYDQLCKTIKLADKIGVKLVGLNSTGNILYASKKYGKYGLVDGRLFAIKKTEFRWRDDISCITDYYATIYHLNKYKGNLILQDCYADFERYGAGGIGTLEERANDKKKDILILKNLYPNNVIVKDKKGQPKGTHIKIKR
tara:strand:+ start:309 stop:1025 length:717 start_codon:yes stop_codon:yes gene_type:complete